MLVSFDNVRAALPSAVESGEEINAAASLFLGLEVPPLSWLLRGRCAGVRSYLLSREI